ncbi:MAG: flagellar export protein FliJ [Treponema sp.]|jgi:flagellar FliJ protein|nr:flagellar export protein FliJ [Treponema sp.]
MKKYSFELEDILEYKKFDQEQAEQEFAKALSVENEIQQKIEYIAQQYLITKEKFKNTKNFDLIISQNQYFNLLDFQKEELLKELAQAKIITEQKKEILQEKMKATSALEKLKERDKEEYDQLVNFEENEFIDDLATTHFKG